MKGKVLWFSGPKGFGFISREDGEADVFVHHSELVMKGYRELKADQIVEFELMNGPRDKIQAGSVKVISGGE